MILIGLRERSCSPFLKENAMTRISVLCVGAGGTGTFFISGFGGFLSAFRNDDVSISFGIIDGDYVERKNLERQTGFVANDIGLNKAVIMAEAVRDVVPEHHERMIKAFPSYVDDAVQISKAFRALQNGYSVPYFQILVGCVDNHRARQEMEKYFLSQDDIMYVDAANEYRSGEVVTAYRIGGKSYGKVRSRYFPEVSEDKSPRASEQSCGVINEKDPQHRDTNHFSGLLCVSRVNRFITAVLEKKDELAGELLPGLQVFDSFSGEVYYEKWKEESKADERGNENTSNGKKSGKKKRPGRVAS